MTIEVIWDDEQQTVVRYIFPEAWTWEEFFAAVDTAKAMIDTAPGWVGVIMDGPTRTMKVPPNMISNTKQVLSRTHPKTKIVVVVINNPFINVMVTTLSRISGMRGRILVSTEDLNEARRMVREHLATLAP